MPELPEVETTIRGLKPKVLHRTFIDIWTNYPKLVKKPASFLDFKSQIKGKRILNIKRAGKNILFELSGDLVMLVHQKMTGHLLYGKWKEENGKWISQNEGPIKSDPQNRFLHLIFFLDNGFQIALSDLRKFAKIELWKKGELNTAYTLKDLGPDALKVSLTQFKNRLQKKKGKIKQVLMDQSVIAGVGNIYSDEILFEAKVHPAKLVIGLKENQISAIYKAMKRILALAVKNKGTSISDYRVPTGEKGHFSEMRKIYRKTGQKCPRCKGIISRLKMGGRSAHFCPKCQKLA
ncbi:MAG: DNA-formamidopyrimidine glycosylase [Candidatus Pacebacteria bacterium]|nr:DNA-formamidopyrimidine glycosylase [Candidatus Paceibacterota bacterium]